jgi:hypothetical protein
MGLVPSWQSRRRSNGEFVVTASLDARSDRAEADL